MGLQNYVTLLTNELWSPRFWALVQLHLLFRHFLVQNPISLLLAALLSQATCVAATSFATYFLPTMLSFVIVGFIWQLILSPIWGISGLPQLLRLGFPFPSLGCKPETALITLSLISVWQFIGIPMMLFYAALISIPEELVEAASTAPATSLPSGASSSRSSCLRSASLRS